MSQIYLAQGNFAMCSHSLELGVSHNFQVGVPDALSLLSTPQSPSFSPTRLGRVAPGAARIPQPLPLAQRQGPAPWGPGAFSPLGTGASHSADAPLGPRPPPLPLHQGQGPQQVWGLSRSHKGTEDDHKITNSEDGREQEVPWTLCAPQRASVHPTGTGRLPPDERGAGEECPALFCCWSMLGPG